MSFGISTFSQNSFGSAGTDHVVTLTTSLLLTGSVGTVTISGNANFTLPSNLLTGSLGTPTYSGTAAITLSGVEATTAISNAISVSGTASLTLSSVLLTSSIDAVYLEIINPNEYARERTIYIPYRESNIKSLNTISPISRTTVLSSRLNSQHNTVIVPKQNRTIVVPQRQHTITTKVAA